MRKFLIATLALLSACAAPPRPVPPAAMPGQEAAPHVAWQVTRGRVEVRVYRDGPLAQLGHNHVLVSNALTGELQLREPLAASSFELRLPPGSFSVDEPQARAAAGADFPGELSLADREATRGNLQGEAVLDAANFPLLTLRSVALEGGPAKFVAHLSVGLRGQDRRISMPFTIERDAARLRASGAVRVTHAALGLEPFSVAFGALRVAEEISIRFEVEAAPRIPGRAATEPA